MKRVLTTVTADLSVHPMNKPSYPGPVNDHVIDMTSQGYRLAHLATASLNLEMTAFNFVWESDD